MKTLLKGRIVLLWAILLLFYGCATQKVQVIEKVKQELPQIPREFRAAWIASVANINWPSKPGLTTVQQKSEAIVLLDLLKKLNFNAAILQIRPQCDALYQSDLEPWSYYLSGVQGQAPDPYYDPLEFWVNEAHKRGMELHAWLNPYRAHHVSGGPVSEKSVVNKHPEMVVKLKSGYYWLDPANPATQDHSFNVVMDIVKRYDIDGIHFDDYFYPYPSYNNNEDFPDDESWQTYLDSGGTLSRDDWRRDAVNHFIKRLYQGIHQEKSYVKFGLSPFGIWRPGHPPSIQGFDQYNKLYADARLWLNKGWIDYFTPQLYWTVNKIPQSYPVLLGWWARENLKQRHLWPGISIGQLQGEKAADETINQIMITRGMVAEGPGNVHWSIGPLQTNKELASALSTGPYKEKALIPASPWMDAAAPAPPQVTPESDDDSLTLGWIHDPPADVFHTLVYARYANSWHYQILGPQENFTTLPRNILKPRFNLAALDQSKGLKEMLEPLNRLAVSAVDRSANEGAATFIPVSIDTTGNIAHGLKKEMMDRIFIEYNQDSLPGAAVMVIKKGRIIFQRGYGFANIEQKDSVTVHSNFRLASLTKAFTALSVLQLVEKGKLSLDSKLRDILKDFPAYGDKIRIRDLLQHTSALPDYENLTPADQTEQLHDADVLNLLKKADTLYFEPGEKYKYSNSAYALLSLIIEKISGQPFREYLQQNIFEPAGMTHTLAFEKGINQLSDRAMGYSINDKRQVELTDQSLTSAVLGDGGIYSNLQDMYHWDQVLYTDKLLSRNLLEQALSHQELNSGESIDYGFGWHLEKYREMDICYHTGSTKGFRNVLYRIPQQQFSVVILTNRNGFGTLSTMQLARRITDLFLFE